MEWRCQITTSLLCHESIFAFLAHAQILEHSQQPSLLKVTLQTLQRFLTWIPLGFIFQTKLIDVLLNKFFKEPLFRNDALDCLTEIGTLTDLEPTYDPLFRQLFVAFLQRLGDVFRKTSANVPTSRPQSLGIRFERASVEVTANSPASGYR